MQHVTNSMSPLCVCAREQAAGDESLEHAARGNGFPLQRLPLYLCICVYVGVSIARHGPNKKKFVTLSKANGYILDVENFHYIPRQFARKSTRCHGESTLRNS